MKKTRRLFVLLGCLLVITPTPKASGAWPFGLSNRFQVASEKTKFKKRSGFPHGRPGYVIDYIQPLKHGGAAKAYNMQWLPKAAAKTKHKLE